MPRPRNRLHSSASDTAAGTDELQDALNRTPKVVHYRSQIGRLDLEGYPIPRLSINNGFTHNHQGTITSIEKAGGTGVSDPGQQRREKTDLIEATILAVERDQALGILDYGFQEMFEEHPEGFPQEYQRNFHTGQKPTSLQNLQSEMSELLELHNVDSDATSKPEAIKKKKNKPKKKQRVLPSNSLHLTYALPEASATPSSQDLLETGSYELLSDPISSSQNGNHISNTVPRKLFPISELGEKLCETLRAQKAKKSPSRISKDSKVDSLDRDLIAGHSPHGLQLGKIPRPLTVRRSESPQANDIFEIPRIMSPTYGVLETKDTSKIESSLQPMDLTSEIIGSQRKQKPETSSYVEAIDPDLNTLTMCSQEEPIRTNKTNPVPITKQQYPESYDMDVEKPTPAPGIWNLPSSDLRIFESPVVENKKGTPGSLYPEHHADLSGGYFQSALNNLQHHDDHYKTHYHEKSPKKADKLAISTAYKARQKTAFRNTFIWRKDSHNMEVRLQRSKTNMGPISRQLEFRCPINVNPKNISTIQRDIPITDASRINAPLENSTAAISITRPHTQIPGNNRVQKSLREILSQRAPITPRRRPTFAGVFRPPISSKKVNYVPLLTEQTTRHEERESNLEIGKNRPGSADLESQSDSIPKISFKGNKTSTPNKVNQEAGINSRIISRKRAQTLFVPPLLHAQQSDGIGMKIKVIKKRAMTITRYIPDKVPGLSGRTKSRCKRKSMGGSDLENSQMPTMVRTRSSTQKNPVIRDRTPSFDINRLSHFQQVREAW
ncbi:hypothetical protein EDC01DRAFT_652832 [Geopyxis carbonaria]|nr:hypothetical protein EDC01DRAFT_652832 [Geopyxis carbonaria]